MLNGTDRKEIALRIKRLGNVISRHVQMAF